MFFLFSWPRVILVQGLKCENVEQMSPFSFLVKKWEKERKMLSACPSLHPSAKQVHSKVPLIKINKKLDIKHLWTQ